jgi:hypothetical protein
MARYDSGYTQPDLTIHVFACEISSSIRAGFAGFTVSSNHCVMVLCQVFGVSLKNYPNPATRRMRASYRKFPTRVDNTHTGCCNVSQWLPALFVFAELAEVLAMDFTTEGTPKLNLDFRWEGQEEAKACFSLVVIIDHHGSRIVQFSHFSVKEYLTSNRLAALEGASHYYIFPERAHTAMAQACLAVLLRLDYHTNWKNIESFPLADYAATQFVNHGEFGNVISRIGGGMDALLDADKPHFTAWLWVLYKRYGYIKIPPERRRAVPYTMSHLRSNMAQMFARGKNSVTLCVRARGRCHYISLWTMELVRS